MTDPNQTARMIKAKLAELDAKVAAEKEATGEVSLETALVWWDTATAIRDMRSAGCAAMPGLRGGGGVSGMTDEQNQTAPVPRDPFCEIMKQVEREQEWAQFRDHELKQYLAELAKREQLPRRPDAESKE